LIQNIFPVAYNSIIDNTSVTKICIKGLGFNSRHKCWEYLPLTSGMTLGQPVSHPKLTTHLPWHEKQSGAALFSARMVL